MIDWIKRAWRGWFGPSVAEVMRTDLVEGAAFLRARDEATIAQKNVRLASIARTRGELKDQIARLKRNKKRTSHLQAELARLTRMELELESGK